MGGVVDRLTPERRSRLMSRVKGKNTGPELALRAALRAAGLAGYRLHRKDLPGKPDIAYGRWKVAVFIDGEFWHGKKFDPDKATPFWRDKIAANQARDARADALLAEAGWVVVRVWDTDVRRDPDGCVHRIADALTAAGRASPGRSEPNH